MLRSSKGVIWGALQPFSLHQSISNMWSVKVLPKTSSSLGSFGLSVLERLICRSLEEMVRDWRNTARRAAVAVRDVVRRAIVEKDMERRVRGDGEKKTIQQSGAKKNNECQFGECQDSEAII